jgi:hypothetical protein
MSLLNCTKPALFPESFNRTNKGILVSNPGGGDLNDMQTDKKLRSMFLFVDYCNGHWNHFNFWGNSNVLFQIMWINHERAILGSLVRKGRS